MLLNKLGQTEFEFAGEANNLKDEYLEKEKREKFILGAGSQGKRQAQASFTGKMEFYRFF